jgi:mannose-6-phosphate isomerase-like protein (cupin superfamily)
MKLKLTLCALLLAALAWPAGEPAGFQYWSAAGLKGLDQKLAPKIDQNHIATEALFNFANYSFTMVVRDATGQSEVHETIADVLTIEAGEATFVYGGEVVGGQTTAPHEIRGTGIRGGTEQKVGPGDVITIPAKLPHQMRVAPGKRVAYLTMKVNQ